MRTRTRFGFLAGAAVLALTLPMLASMGGPAQAATTLNVDLSSSRGPAKGVGEGFLYGMNADATLPTDQYLQPLGVNAWRAGGHLNRAWIGDGYKYGSQTQADVATVLAQARKLTRAPYNAQYQVLLTDLYGLDGGQPSNTVYPCANGDCSNWVTFIDTMVTTLQASGLNLAYDIDNEPDISVFWPNASVNSTQYFQMWDTAYREIRRLAPNALIVGPSFAYTPQARPSQWSTWLAHVKAAGTVPDWITNHDEGDGDDPVAVGQSLNNALTAQGIALRPLSANEYQPADRQWTGTTAWFLARFAQSGYSNAMRGNWACCLTPNLTGVLTNSGGSWQPNGNWWALRRAADMTGTLVNTSGQVGNTAIAASTDSTAKRAVAILGDNLGYTGAATVNFTGLASQSWLSGGGSVKVVVERIPDQYPLSAPVVVLNQTMSTSSGSVSVPITFQAAHDAFAITVTPAGNPTTTTTTTTTPRTTTTTTTPRTTTTTTTPGTTTTTTTPGTTTSTTTTSSSTTTTTTGSGGSGCSASYQVVGSWPGGFQGGVTVTNTGSQATSRWTVTWSFTDGQVVTQLWGGRVTQSGSAVTVTNEVWNASLNPGASATFGFLGNTGTTNRTPADITCSAG